MNAALVLMTAALLSGDHQGGNAQAAIAPAPAAAPIVASGSGCTGCTSSAPVYHYGGGDYCCEETSCCGGGGLFSRLRHRMSSFQGFGLFSGNRCCAPSYDACCGEMITSAPCGDAGCGTASTGCCDTGCSGGMLYQSTSSYGGCCQRSGWTFGCRLRGLFRSNRCDCCESYGTDVGCCGGGIVPGGAVYGTPGVVPHGAPSMAPQVGTPVPHSKLPSGGEKKEEKKGDGSGNGNQAGGIGSGEPPAAGNNNGAITEPVPANDPRNLDIPPAVPTVPPVGQKTPF
ncbi:MAG: hypothetical protein ACFCD0_07860 [Gemmataceae bacterium]